MSALSCLFQERIVVAIEIIQVIFLLSVVFICSFMFSLITHFTTGYPLRMMHARTVVLSGNICVLCLNYCIVITSKLDQFRHVVMFSLFPTSWIVSSTMLTIFLRKKNISLKKLLFMNSLLLAIGVVFFLIGWLNVKDLLRNFN
jgi:hypothetical protein